MPRRHRAGAGLQLALACVLVLAAGCTSSREHDPVPAPTGAAPTGAAPSIPGTVASGPVRPVPLDPGDWPTFGHDVGRSGVVTDFPTLDRPTVAWRAGLDGAVYGQPLYVHGLLYAATENDTVYALRPSDGTVVWSRHLGTPVPGSDLPCGNIDPLGITGTMAYDPATGTVFAVAETTGGVHTLWGLDLETGATVQQRNVDPPLGDRIAHQQRSALTVLGSRVYVAYGGLEGDCAHYIGQVIGAPTRGTSPYVTYAIPTTREGGIWSPGGAVVDGGRLLYAAGNGESTRGYDGSDSVVALDPALRLLDRFSPATWADDNARDLDLGSMTPALVAGYVYADGKRGTGYLLRPDRFGGIGGDVAHAEICRAFGAAAVDGATMYVPCADGTRSVTVGADGSLHVNWHTSVPANGSPILGGGWVWVVDYHADTLFVFNPATGGVHTGVKIGDVPHFATPTLAHGQVFVGTMTGVIAVH